MFGGKSPIIMSGDVSESKKTGVLSVSGIVATGKDLVAFLRDALIFLLALLLLFFPKKLNDKLVEAGFEEGSVVGFKWKAGLAQSDISLKEAQASITDLRAQLDSVSHLLSQASQRVDDPAFQQKVARLETQTQQLTTASLKTQASVKSTITANASLVKTAQVNLNENNSWGVVFSGDASLDAAKYEVGLAARRYGIPDAVVYYRQGMYRSVALADTREEAEELLLKARKRSKDAYIVPMATWCPSAGDKEGYQQCAVK